MACVECRACVRAVWKWIAGKEALGVGGAGSNFIEWTCIGSCYIVCDSPRRKASLSGSGLETAAKAVFAAHPVPSAPPAIAFWVRATIRGRPDVVSGKLRAAEAAVAAGAVPKPNGQPPTAYPI